MALRKSTPAFEEVTDTVDEKETEMTETQEKTNTEVAEVKAKPLAKAKSVSNIVALAFKDLENQIAAESLEWNTLPRITVAASGFKADDIKLGKEIELSLLSYHTYWMISAGSQSDEANKLVRTSFDGQTIADEDMSVEEYIQYLKDEGYENASKKTYVGLIGFLNSDELNEIVFIQVPPSSVANFTRFQLNLGFKVASGSATLPEGNTLRITHDVRTIGKNDVNIMLFPFDHLLTK